MTNAKSIFSKNIKKYRIAMGLSQEQFAEKCSTSKNYISQIESGYRFASAKSIDVFAATLGVEPHDLFRDTESVTDRKELLQKQLSEKIDNSIREILKDYRII